SSSPHLRVLAPARPGRPSASLTWVYFVERRGVEPRVSWSQTRRGHRAVALDVRGCGSLLTRGSPHSDRPRPVYCDVRGDYAPLQQSPWTSECISRALAWSTWYQVHTRLRGPSPGAGSRTPTYGFGDRRASVTPHPSSGPGPALPCRSPRYSEPTRISEIRSTAFPSFLGVSSVPTLHVCCATITNKG